VVIEKDVRTGSTRGEDTPASARAPQPESASTVAAMIVMPTLMKPAVTTLSCHGSAERPAR
jgi:hypothetical protein